MPTVRCPITGLASEQSIYNLMQRSVEREVIPAAQHYGLGLLPWSPLHGGLLGGVLQKQHDGVRRLGGRAAEALAGSHDAVAAFESLAAELGHAPGDVALAWLLHQAAVTAPIIGPRTAAQLEDSLRALDISLDGAALSRLDEIFPGPKTAPEDYAW